MNARHLVLLFGTASVLVAVLAGCSSPALHQDDARRLRRHIEERTFLVMHAERVSDVRVTNRTVYFKPEGASGRMGTAAAISADGYVLTAAHVLSRKISNSLAKPWLIDINPKQPRAIPAEFVWLSHDGDFALLKAGTNTPHYFEWSHPEESLPRHEVVVQGGIKSRMAVGSVRRAVRMDAAEQEFAIVSHSAKTRFGDSGGPVVDSHGKLIGINTARLILGMEDGDIDAGGGHVVRPNVVLTRTKMEHYRAVRETAD